MSAERPAIASIARRAGVAKSTVSRVLNGGYASPGVKARVEAVMRESGYAPSATARNLSLGRTGCLGLVVGGFGSDWAGQILVGLESQSVRHQFTLMLSSRWLAGQPRSCEAVEDWIRHRRVDGIIFCRADAAEGRLLEAARAAGIAVVHIGPDADFGPGIYLRTANVEGGTLLGRHLCGLGHRRVDMVGGPRDSVDTQERLKGLGTALREGGAGLGRIHYARFRHEDGVDYADAWLKSPPPARATAAVFANDAMALGCLRRLLEKGVRVPAELSVAGFDDVPASALTWPGLTSVRQEMTQMGGEAARLIAVARSRGGLKEYAHTFAMRLVPRESTGRCPQSRR